MLCWCLPVNGLWHRPELPVVCAKTATIVFFGFTKAAEHKKKTHNIVAYSDRISSPQIYSKFEKKKKKLSLVH